MPVFCHPGFYSLLEVTNTGLDRGSERIRGWSVSQDGLVVLQCILPVAQVVVHISARTKGWDKLAVDLQHMLKVSLGQMTHPHPMMQKPAVCSGGQAVWVVA